MMHLNADQLVDLAEGARPESAAPHLADCARCRAQLAELRATMSVVARVDVPEPSPLFWGHFSRRVNEAVAAEQGTAARSFVARLLGARALHAGLVALASLILVVLATSRTNAPGTRIEPADTPAVAGPDVFVDAAVEGDPSLSLVAALASSLEGDAAGVAGLAKVGSAEHAVTHMNDADLRELHRLLREELAP